jgi:hypothetical protein
MSNQPFVASTETIRGLQCLPMSNQPFVASTEMIQRFAESSMSTQPFVASTETIQRFAVSFNEHPALRGFHRDDSTEMI